MALTQLWQIGLTTKHLEAIGLVAVRWSNLENFISEIIHKLINVRHMRALAITAHLNERTRIEMCKAIAENIFGTRPLFKELKTHLDFILNDLYPKRNDVIHGFFGYGGKETTSILPVKARGKVTFGPRKEFTAKDIDKIAAEIEEAHEKLEAIKRKIDELLPTMSNWP